MAPGGDRGARVGAEIYIGSIGNAGSVPLSDLSETVEITNQRGLHARASAKFVTFVSRLPESVSVEVEKGGSRVNGTSIMGLMMLGAAKGDSITIHTRGDGRSEEHTSELQSQMRNSYAVFCLKKKKYHMMLQ